MEIKKPPQLLSQKVFTLVITKGCCCLWELVFVFFSLNSHFLYFRACVYSSFPCEVPCPPYCSMNNTQQIFIEYRASQVAQEFTCQGRRWQEMWVRSLGWEDSQEEETAIRSSILAWKIPWTEEPGGLKSVGPQRVGHDLALSMHASLLQESRSPDPP